MTADQLMGVHSPADAWNPWKSVFAIWGRMEKGSGESRNAACCERAVSALPPYLRHDMGELDCRPPEPRPLAETLRSAPQTLETMWLRPLR